MDLRGNTDLEIDAFLQIEQKYDLYHTTIEGVQPWMYFRSGFWSGRIRKKQLALGEFTQKWSLMKRCMCQMISAVKLIAGGNAKRIRKADIIFCSHARRVKNDGYYECIYTGQLSQKYSNSIVIEEPWQSGHLTPVKEKNIYYTDFLRIREILYYQLHYRTKTGKYKKIYAQVEDRFAKALAEIERAYEYEAPYERIYEELTQIILKVGILKKELRKIVDRVQPKLIVEVVYNSKRCMIFNELAKEMGIPTIELQHGMVSSFATYNFPDGCGEICQCPDYVFMFSEYFKKRTNYPIDSKNIIVTGFPYFERQLKKYAGTRTHVDNIINILFVSQGTIGAQLSHLAVDLCEVSDSKKYHIIYKLHPEEYIGWKNRYPWLLRENIEVADSQESSIYELFSRADIQVGVYSTAIYEGMGFGLTTYIYDTAYADEMRELCELGYAVMVKDARELYDSIIFGKNQGGGKNKNFWKMDSLRNMCREIDALLETAEVAGGYENDFS